MKREELPVKFPCHVDWRRMTPTEGGRFCGDCRKVVRDLSALTEDEAKALLRAARPGELCMRARVDAEGEIVFAKPQVIPTGLLFKAKRAVLAIAPLALAACRVPLVDDRYVQGEPAYVEPPAADGGTDAEPTADGGADDASPDGSRGDGGVDAAADDGGDGGRSPI